MKNRIIVTGSSGMIGTALCEKLLEMGVLFLGVDKVENRWNRHIETLTMRKDLTEKLSYPTHSDYDMIIHLAANARVFDLVKDPDMARDNILMTYNMLEFARESGAKKFILASSREVYGNASGKLFYKEDEVNLDLCESPYTASKISSEALVQAYCRCYGINFIIIRFSNVYGRYDYNDRVVPLFIARALKDLPLTVFGGNKILDFTYIDDAINGLYQVISQFGKAKNRVYNLAGGEGYSITEVATKIKTMLASNSEITFKKSRIGEVEEFIANIDRARFMFNYDPKYNIDQGLTETIAWYRPRLGEYLDCLRDKEKNNIRGML